MKILFPLLFSILLTVNNNNIGFISISNSISVVAATATATATATSNGATAAVVVDDDDDEDEEDNHNHNQQQQQQQYIVEFYHEIDNKSIDVAIDLVRVVVGKKPSSSPKTTTTSSSSSTTTTTTYEEEEINNDVKYNIMLELVQENMVPFQIYKVMTNGPGEIFRLAIINNNNNNITSSSSSSAPSKSKEEDYVYVISEIIIKENQYKYQLILQNTKTTKYLEPKVNIISNVLPLDICKNLIRIGEDEIGFDENEWESIDQNYPLDEQQPASTIDVMNYDTIYVPQLYDIIKPYVPKIAHLVKEQQQQRNDDDDDDAYHNQEKEKELPELDWVFFRKYTPNSRYSLQTHCDTNTHSVTIALNNDYDGGGLFYIKPPIYLQKLYNDQPDKEGRPYILPNYRNYNFTNQLIIRRRRRRRNRIDDEDIMKEDDLVVVDNDEDIMKEDHTTTTTTTTGNNSTTITSSSTKTMSSQSSSSSSSQFPDIVFPKCNTGDALIYNYTVYHGISPILNGVRYALVLFFDMDNPAVQHELINHDDDYDYDYDGDDSEGENEEDDDSFVVTLKNMLEGVEIDLIWILDYDLYEYVVDDDDDDGNYFGEELVISINGQQRNGRIAYRNLQHNEQVQYVAFVGDTIIAVRSNTTTADNNSSSNNNNNDNNNNTTESWTDISFLSEFVIEKEKNLYEIYNIDEDEDEDINDGNGIEVKEAAQGAAEEEL